MTASVELREVCVSTLTWLDPNLCLTLRDSFRASWLQLFDQKLSLINLKVEHIYSSSINQCKKKMCPNWFMIEIRTIPFLMPRGCVLSWPWNFCLRGNTPPMLNPWVTQNCVGSSCMHDLIAPFPWYYWVSTTVKDFFHRLFLSLPPPVSGVTSTNSCAMSLCVPA